MKKQGTGKQKLLGRHVDDLARIRKAERDHESRRKYVLGNLVLVLGRQAPGTAAQIIRETAKLASRDYDRAELRELEMGNVSYSRTILLGALLLNYAEQVPSDRRVFDALRPLARPEDRGLLADVFVHHERYRPGSRLFDTPEEYAARNAEKAERRKDIIRLAAMHRIAREGFSLPSDDDDDTSPEPDRGSPRPGPRDER